MKDLQLPDGTSLGQAMAIKNASRETLESILERLQQSHELREREARLREMEEYMGHLEDAVILAHERQALSDSLVDQERLLFEAYEALATGDKEKAVLWLQNALRLASRIAKSNVGERRPGSASRRPRPRGGGKRGRDYR